MRTESFKQKRALSQRATNTTLRDGREGGKRGERQRQRERDKEREIN